MSSKRLYISSDIEGVSGVVTGAQLAPGGFEYQQAREWMTAEVTAACEAAFDSGIDEIVISDSHGNGQNLLLDKLPDNVQVVRSWPRPLCMMQGVEIGEYVGALLLGYHSGATNSRGVLAHTVHSRGIAELRLNGEAASETVISAATAGHFGVPVLMVSGDDAYIEHASDVLSGVEGAVVKWADSTTSARNLLPRDACKEIKSKVTAALDRVDLYRPFVLDSPIDLQITCLNRKAAELLEYLPYVKRLNTYDIQTTGKDMVEISKFLSFLVGSGVLTPS